MAGKKKPGIPVKGINIKLRMINDLIDVTGSAKDSWNPAEISDDMKAIAYIHDLADTWNPAQLNEALKYFGFATIDSWNPAIIEETKNKLVKYFLPTDASGNPIELDLKGALPYEVTSLTIKLLPIQSGTGDPAPDNVRPITGRDSVTLTVNGDDIGTTFENTVYGGTLDLLNGKLTIDKGTKGIGSLTWFKHSTPGRFYAQFASGDNVKPAESTSVAGEIICSQYKNVAQSYLTLQDGNFSIDSTANPYINIYDTSKSELSAGDFKTAMSGVTVCYSLATPIEIDLTAEQISLLKGNNVLSTDGDNINITYKAILNS